MPFPVAPTDLGLTDIKDFFEFVEKKYRASRHQRAVSACYELLVEAGYYTEVRGPHQEQRLRDLIEDADSERVEILYDYIQTMMSSMLDESRFCMLRLAAYYFRRKQLLDWVYKRVSSLILQASRTDIEQISKLMALVERYVLDTPKRPFVPKEITIRDAGDGIFVRVEGDTPEAVIEPPKKDIELWAGLDALERSRLTHFSAKNREAGMKVTFNGGTLSKGLPVLIHVFPPRDTRSPR